MTQGKGVLSERPIVLREAHIHDNVNHTETCPFWLMRTLCGSPLDPARVRTMMSFMFL